MFSQGDQASESALEKHVPAGIVARRDIKYGDGGDEVFDLYYPAKATGPQPRGMASYATGTRPLDRCSLIM